MSSEALDFRADLVRGLRGTPKELPSKYLYDREGSQLFERICDLDEYYPTRTEIGIMRSHVEEIADRIGRTSRLVELGSGSSQKTRVLLDSLAKSGGPAAYLPLDISRDALFAAAARLRLEYPGLTVCPIHADYTRAIQLPPGSERTILFFPGATIGNFTPADAATFLTRLRAACGPDGGLLVGVDLKKDPTVLHAAYNDRGGVTARFNLNVLRRANRELGASFVPRSFAHYAFYQPTLGRIEMHLVSRGEQMACLGDGTRFSFGEGESILTEYSYKYDLAGFARLARSGGFRVEKVWLDPEQLFSVQYLSLAS